MAKGKAILDTIKGVWNYAPKAIQPSKYAPQFAKNAGYATNRALVGKMGAKGVRNLKAGGAVALGLGSLIGDSGPEEDETMQRAMNQLRYGADMTDEQLQEAQASGQAFRDTGAIGENGLSEADARAYIAQNADQRGTAEKIGGGVLNALSFIPGAGQAVGLLGGMEYDRRLGKARNLNLENIVGKLRGDANEGKIRRNMEGTMGKFMTEGLLDNEFGRGKVRGSGGIKPAIDEMAQAEESAALKQYEAIKAKDGVFAAISSPYAAKAGRQVYLDVQEASGGDKNNMEALLSGAGLTDEETSARYYGDPKANAASNQKLAEEAIAKQSASQQALASASAQTSLEAQDKARSGEIDLKPATNPEEVRNAQATIATQKGFHGQSPISIEQQAYMNARGQKSDVQMQNSLNSPEWKALFERHQKQATANAQAARNYIAPQHRMGVSPTGQASRDAEAARIFGGNTPSATPSVPAQVNAAATTPGIPSNVAPARPNPELVPPVVPGAQGQKNPVMAPTPYGVGTATPGFPKLPDLGAPVRSAVDRALTQQSSRPGNVMAPTPYGIGTATPGMPQVPDIGAPVRGAVDRALTQQSSRPGNVMAPSPYGLGTATPGMPQAPDIGAPVRNAVQGALTQQSSPPGVAPKKPMSQAEIAQMIAEQERQKVDARNRANPKSSPMPRPDAMRRFR